MARKFEEGTKVRIEPNFYDKEGGVFEITDSTDQWFYANGWCYNLDGTVQGGEEDGVVAFEIEPEEGGVIAGEGVTLTVSEKPFEFGDKVNAFGVNGAIVKVYENSVKVYFDGMGEGQISVYSFSDKGIQESWHKTPSLFHGWVNEQ